MYCTTLNCVSIRPIPSLARDVLPHPVASPRARKGYRPSRHHAHPHGVPSRFEEPSCSPNPMTNRSPIGCRQRLLSTPLETDRPKGRSRPLDTRPTLCGLDAYQRLPVEQPHRPSCILYPLETLDRLMTAVSFGSWLQITACGIGYNWV